MTARKRASGESYEAYRKNLKREAGALERKLLGLVLWSGYIGTARRYTQGGKRGLVGKGEVGGYKFVAYS